MKKATALVPMALLAIATACSTNVSTNAGSGSGSAATTGAAGAAAAPRALHGVYWKRGAKPTGVFTPPNPATGGCASPSLQYGGGQVISNVEVVQVNWGSNVNASITALFEQWYPAVVPSVHLSWLSEYNTPASGGTNQQIGVGTYHKNPASNGSYTITPTNTGTTLDQNAIGAEIIAQIKAGNLPTPTKDAQGNSNTIYMIDFPPGMTEELNLGGQIAASCAAFCGYHETAMDATLGNVYFGVHPDMGAGSGCEAQNNQWVCGGDVSETIASAVVHGHELIEAVTDPVNNGAWLDSNQNCGEIGDICANELGSCGDASCQSPSVGSLSIGGTTYYMQTEWSNKQNDCVVQGPAMGCTSNAQCASANPSTPICDPTTKMCRGCTNADCSGTTPACETTGSLAGQCVQCTQTSHADCTGATPFCDKTTDTCRGCTAADCTGATPVCEMGGSKSGLCVQCDVTNTQACTGTTPVCNTSTNTCVECVKTSDCAANQTCDTSTNTCVSQGGMDAGAPDSSAGNDSGAGMDSGSAADSGAFSDSGSGGKDSGSSGGQDSGSASNDDSGAGSDDGGSSSSGSTGNSGGCAVSSTGASTSGFGSFAGLIFAAAVIARRRKSS